jgi:hypothetical protein
MQRRLYFRCVSFQAFENSEHGALPRGIPGDSEAVESRQRPLAGNAESCSIRVRSAHGSY